MNHNDLFERATASYHRRTIYPTISQQPSATSSGFDHIQGQEVYVLRNTSGPLMAFKINPSGRIGQPVDLPVEEQG